MAASGHTWLSKSSVDWYQLDRELDSVPSDFRTARFDSLKHVVEILSSVDPKDTVEELKDSKDRLEGLIDQVVDTYHTGFNVAIQNYSHILQLFTESRDQIDALRQSFVDARRKLGSQSRLLSQQWSKNIKLEYACRILDQVAQVTEIPAEIDKFQNQKDWPQAVRALTEGCGKLCTEELSRIHALRKVRDDLAARWKMLQSEITKEIQRRVYETDLTDVDGASSTSRGRMTHRRAGNLSAGQTPIHLRHVSQGSEKDSNCSVRGSSFTLRQRLPEGEVVESSAAALSIKELVDCLAQMGSLGELKDAIAKNIAGRTRVAILKLVKATQAGKKVHNKGKFGIREVQGIMTGSSSHSQAGPVSPEVAVAAQELLEAVCSQVLKILRNLLHVFGIVCQSDGTGEPTAVQQFRTQIQEQQQQFLSMRLSQSTAAAAAAVPSQAYMEQDSLHALRGAECLDEACLDIWRCAQNEVLQFAADLLNCSLSQRGQNRSDSQNWLSRLEADKFAKSKNKGGNLEEERKSKMTFSFGLRVMGDSQNDRGPGSGEEDATTYSQLIKEILKHPGGEYLSPSLYQVIVQFVEGSQTAIKAALDKHEEGMGDKAQALKKKHHQLGQFIENFIMDSFVPQVWVDFRGQVTAALEDAEAFKPQTRTRSLSKSNRPDLDSVLKAASVAEKMVKEVSEWVPAIPPFASSLTGVIENILGRFLEAFVVKINSALGELICGKKASNPDIVSLMAQETDAALMPDPTTFYSIAGGEVVDNSLNAGQTPATSLSSGESDMAEAEIIKSILAEKPIRLDQVMARPGNFDKMVEVATLCNSLDFIASSITGLISKYHLPASPGSGPGEAGISRLKSRKSRNISIALPDTLFGSLTSLIDRYRALSGLCIRALRLEMVCLAAYHITELTSITHLCEDDDRTEMPPSLGALIRNTARAEEEIAPHLPLQKRKYVLSILPSACTKIFMWILADIKEINLAGVERITRMLSVLQPALSSFLSPIVGGSFRVFDHARAYYSMLNMSVEDFLAYVAERQGRFLYSEWKVLLEVHVPGRWVAGEHIQRLEKFLESRRTLGTFSTGRRTKTSSRHVGKA